MENNEFWKKTCVHHHDVKNRIGLLMVTTEEVAIETTAGQELKFSIQKRLELLAAMSTKCNPLSVISFGVIGVGGQILKANREKLIEISSTLVENISSIVQEVETMIVEVRVALAKWLPASNDHQEFTQLLEELICCVEQLYALKERQNSLCASYSLQ